MAETHAKMKDNVFVYDGKTTLAFCDLTGAMSGELMKGIGLRQPRIIEQLKVEVKNAKIGDILKIENYVFVIMRKHYANKISAATIAPMINNIISFTSGMDLKTCEIDFPVFRAELNKIPNLKWFSKCDWPW